MRMCAVSCTKLPKKIHAALIISLWLQLRTNLSLSSLCSLRKYHKYRTPTLHEVLPTFHERSNPYDQYAIQPQEEVASFVVQSRLMLTSLLHQHYTNWQPPTKDITLQVRMCTCTMYIPPPVCTLDQNASRPCSSVQEKMEQYIQLQNMFSVVVLKSVLKYGPNSLIISFSLVTRMDFLHQNSSPLFYFYMSILMAYEQVR